MRACKNVAVNLLAAEAFVTVVRQGTLQRAADRLGVSAATVSRRLTDLEAELGVRLVERTTRALRITAVGRDFFDRCVRGFDVIAEARDLVASNESRVVGDVRISAPRNLGLLLLDAASRVQRAHPDLRLSMVETEHILDQYSDDIDLFVRVGPVADERLVARPLGRYPHVLVASTGYAAQVGLPTRPEELASHRIIAFDTRGRLSEACLVPVAGGAPVRIDVRPNLLSNDYETIARAARSGMGIAELPAILCEHRAGLVRVLPQWTLGDATLNLLFAADRLLPRAVRMVIDAILATVPEQVRVAVAGLDA